jgi:DNA-binding PadR family transcriptional regulator
MDMSNRRKRHVSGPAKEAGRLSPTELLILALISRGHAPTLYALQKETLLSAGALVPALAKLREKGLLQAKALGPRKRQQFRVPPAIWKKIEERWKSSTRDHIADCNAVLKLCKAAEIFDLRAAVEYAHEAAEFRASELRKCTNRNGQIEAPEVDFVSYLSYRKVARFYQLQAEEHVLRAVEAALRTDML